jgi:glycopeptide antibiotics resistance protein
LSNINRSLGLINLIGNVLMFVPGGFLLVTALRWTPARAIAVLVAASVAIEVFQYAEGRAADIDDLILNATGAVVGAAIGWFSVRVWRARQQRMGLLSPG